MTSDFFTAALLLFVISIPRGFNGFIEVLRLVTVISEALLNLLFSKPSAMAVPKFPPPIMAIVLRIG
jgi:hypothetical protein